MQPYPTRYLTGLGFFEPVTEIFYLVGRLFFLYYNKSKKQSRLILLLEFFCLSFIGFANCGTNLVLLSGDAFSVLAIRIRRLSIRNIFQNNFYILQFEYPSHWCISSYCVFLKQTTGLFILTQTSQTFTDFREHARTIRMISCTLCLAL